MFAEYNKQEEKEQRAQLSDDSPSKKQELPDAKLHQIISFIKSGVRIVGYLGLIFAFPYGVLLLILAEVIGILEELV